MAGVKRGGEEMGLVFLFALGVVRGGGWVVDGGFDEG